MNKLLARPWRTALRHIDEAAHRPQHANEHLTAACNLLLEALEMSRDDSRFSWIAQDLAVVYALSHDAESARRWFNNAYNSGLKGLKAQIWQAAETIGAEAEKHVRAYEHFRKHFNYVNSVYPYGLCQVKFADTSFSPGPNPFKHCGRTDGVNEELYGVFAD